MLYKFSPSVSYSQFEQCVNHWLDDWKIEFEFPAWAQIFFLFSISSRVDTNWIPRIIGQEEKRQGRTTEPLRSSRAVVKNGEIVRHYANEVLN
jgi:hypothetical protein